MGIAVDRTGANLGRRRIAVLPLTSDLPLNSIHTPLSLLRGPGLAVY